MLVFAALLLTTVRHHIYIFCSFSHLAHCWQEALSLENMTGVHSTARYLRALESKPLTVPAGSKSHAEKLAQVHRLLKEGVTSLNADDK